MGGQLGLECLGLATLKALLIVEDYLRGSAGDLVSPIVFAESYPQPYQQPRLPCGKLVRPQERTPPIAEYCGGK